MSSFEEDGLVSVWAGVEKPDDKTNVLRDLCGVEFYDIDFQEGAIAAEWQLVDVSNLIRQLSYSESFADQAIEEAYAKGISKAKYVIMQLNFAYDVSKVGKQIATDPVFIGCFKWEDDELD